MKKHLGKILLIVVPILASAFLMWPTYRASQLEDLEKDAISRAKAAKSSTDSLSIMEQFRKIHGEDLKQAKAARLKLGLDLRGGMYVTMEVDVVKLIEETAQPETMDEIFRDVIAKTSQEAKGSDEPALEIFKRNFKNIASVQGKSLLNYFDVGTFKDASEEKVLEKLNTNISQAIDQAQEVIRQRIDQYGVSEPNIQKQGNRRILLELPGVQNPTEMRSLLSTTARLEFKLVRNNQDIARAFYKIDKYLSEYNKKGFGKDPIATAVIPGDSSKAEESKGTKADSSKKGDSTAKAKSDTANPYAGLSEKEAQKRYAIDHPFTSMFITYYIPGKNQNIVPVSYVSEKMPDGDYMFRIMKDSIAKFKLLLSRPDIRSLIPGDLQVAIDAKPDTRGAKENIEIFDFYALKKDAELTGEVINDARSSFDQTNNQPVVLMGMTSDGSEAWGRITGANIHKRIAIVLDDRVYSAPTVQNKINGGSSQITGMANAEEAHLLVIVLKAGALKAPVEIIEERVVGPSLGEDSINSGFRASGVGFLLVITFMLLYYKKGGLIADIAVLINVALIIATLAALGGTLSLPGIAGIILTVGMAVDANILIFERIREEMHHGRSLRSAVDEGFQKALSAIIDSNITTFITGAILYFLGTGPVKGFALTLMIGIVYTILTAVTISRAMIELSLRNGATYFDFGQPKNDIIVK